MQVKKNSFSYGAWEAISPEKAVGLLNLLHDNQRKVRQGHVVRLANDMVKGRWQKNPSPIIISESGKLLDGQHRLQAVVLSKQTIEFLVIRNVEENVYPVLDRGISRTTTDSFHAWGETGVNRHVVAIVRAAMGLWGGTDDNQITDADILQVYKKYKDLVYKAESCGYMVTGLFKGMILRALVHFQHDPQRFARIARLCDVMVGNIKNEDMDAIDYNIQLFYQKNKNVGLGGGPRRIWAKKYQVAILLYVEGETFKKIRKTEVENIPPISVN